MTAQRRRLLVVESPHCSAAYAHTTLQFGKLFHREHANCTAVRMY